jgi:hypothetical protein
LCVAEYPYDLYVGCDDHFILDPECTQKMGRRKKEIYDDLTNYLMQIASNLQKDGLRVIVEVCEGPVVDTILTSSDRLCIDLIAMSTLGGGGGNPWMIGSVAGRVLRESKVQVFLVRPDQGEINLDLYQGQKNSLRKISNGFD